MKTRYTVMIAAIAGFGVGAVSVEGLHAQAKAPIYYVGEIEMTNPDAYMKEYAPKAQATIKKAGGRIVAAGTPTAIEGAAPKQRVVVQVWDSMEKIKAWRSSAEYKEARKIGDKYAKFRAYTVEGVPAK